MSVFFQVAARPSFPFYLLISARTCAKLTWTMMVRKQCITQRWIVLSMLPTCIMKAYKQPWCCWIRQKLNTHWYTYILIQILHRASYDDLLSVAWPRAVIVFRERLQSVVAGLWRRLPSITTTTSRTWRDTEDVLIRDAPVCCSRSIERSTPLEFSILQMLWSLLVQYLCAHIFFYFVISNVGHTRNTYGICGFILGVSLVLRQPILVMFLKMVLNLRTSDNESLGPICFYFCESESKKVAN